MHPNNPLSPVSSPGLTDSGLPPEIAQLVARLSGLNVPQTPPRQPQAAPPSAPSTSTPPADNPSDPAAITIPFTELASTVAAASQATKLTRRTEPASAPAPTLPPDYSFSEPEVDEVTMPRWGLIRFVYRTTERVTAALLALALLPGTLLWKASALLLRCTPSERLHCVGQGGRVLTLCFPRQLPQRPVAGAWFARIRHGFRACLAPLRQLACLQTAAWQIAQGRMAWIGPAPLTTSQYLANSPDTVARLSIPPGWLSPWRLRQWSNSPHSGEAQVTREYLSQRSVRGDLGMLLRAFPLWCLSAGTQGISPRVHLLGININNLSMQEALDDLFTLMHGQGHHQVCFVNADCLNLAFDHPQYRSILDRSARVLADGIGLRLAGSILGQPIRENVNGTDLFPLLCDRLSRSDCGVYFLGGQPGVAERLVENVKTYWPSLKICGFRHGYIAPSEEAQVLAAIREAKPALLLVAMGAPLQEVWIDRHLKTLQVPVCMGVGGLFDFYSGDIPRAPRWLRELGLEWVFRLWQQPGRLWSRYIIGNPKFLGRVLAVRWGLVRHD